ncbi:MAG: thioredoxin family protein [Planctomycetaceae bacterium]
MVRTASTMLPLGTPCPEFSLPDVVKGKSVAPNDFDDRPLLVMFICNHCPFVKHLQSALAEFGREYQAKGLSIVAVSSNDADAYPDDSPDKMQDEAKSAGYSFPYLYDESQQVAKSFHAACTPDFFLFDSDHRLAYRGQFDDSRPSTDIPVTGTDLRAACDAVLDGRAVPEPQKPSIGCNIKWKDAPEYFTGVRAEG